VFCDVGLTGKTDMIIPVYCYRFSFRLLLYRPYTDSSAAYTLQCYYYAAFNAPCVGHKDDESQARNAVFELRAPRRHGVTSVAVPVCVGPLGRTLLQTDRQTDRTTIARQQNVTGKSSAIFLSNKPVVKSRFRQQFVPHGDCSGESRH